jgi:ketosteroid isomerase-like protein
MREFFEAEAEYVAGGGKGSASFERLARCLAPSIVVREAPGLPYSGGGDWRGAAGVEDFMAAFTRTWSSMRMVSSQTADGGNHVVAVLDVELTSRRTGRALTTSIVQVYTLEGGLLAEMRPYYWEVRAVHDACVPATFNATPS